MSALKWIGGAALVASLGLNGYLWRARSDASGAKDAKARHAKTDAPAPAASEDTCHAELERCRAEGWKLVAKTIAAQAPPARKEPSAPPPAEVAKATPARQREALCELASAHLRGQWELQKDFLTHAVAGDLSDPKRRAEEARKTASRMADTLGLTSAQADGLSSEYLKIHGEHSDRLISALGRNPPDYEAVLAEVKGTYADEDALIGRLRGGEAVDRWRSQEIQSRTAILAIAATFAGDPWDDTIVW